MIQDDQPNVSMPSWLVLRSTSAFAMVGDDFVQAPPFAAPGINIVTSLPPTSSTTPVVITVVGAASVPLRRAWISVVFPGLIGDEVIHNGNRFGAFYTNGINTRASITNGYQYTILRDGGWPAGSFPLSTSFTINAVDTLGNGL